MKVVIDHLSGSRKGQRQEFVDVSRLRFGRHPDNEVSFDAHTDLDASVRHAELRFETDTGTLRDIGSSNGTWIDGDRSDHATVAAGRPMEIEFGAGGPRIRIFVITTPDHVPPPLGATRPGRALAWALVAAAVAVVGGVVTWFVLG